MKLLTVMVIGTALAVAANTPEVMPLVIILAILLQLPVKKNK
jgi:hypothetical protein